MDTDNDMRMALEKLISDEMEVVKNDTNKVNELLEYTRYFENYVNGMNKSDTNMVINTWEDIVNKATPYLERYLSSNKKFYDLTDKLLNPDEFKIVKQVGKSAFEITMWGTYCYRLAISLLNMYSWFVRVLKDKDRYNSIVKLLDDVNECPPYFL